MTTRTFLMSLHFLGVMILSASALFSCSKYSEHALPLRTGVDTVPASGKPDSALKHYLALGDSYTIGQSVKVNERYPVQVVEKLRAAGFNIGEAEIIATSGWTTNDLLAAIKNKEATPSYDIVTLLIGVNNQYQGRSITEYRSQFTSLLKKAIVFAGNRPNRVFVLSIPDYSVTPFANYSDKEKIAHELDAFNVVNKHISDSSLVHYINVTEESRKAAGDPTLIAYDNLHFSGKEYSIWTSLLMPGIMNVMQ